jgi:nitrile hydratase accessory protein
LSNDQRSDDPVFAEPWQARAFALTRKLTERGHFSQKEWTAALMQALRDAYACGALDDGSHHYEHWVTALETLALAKGLTDKTALGARKEAWREAHRSTPHGKPVTLESRARATPDTTCAAQIRPRSAPTDNPSLQLETNDSRTPR